MRTAPIVIYPGRGAVAAARASAVGRPALQLAVGLVTVALAAIVVTGRPASEPSLAGAITSASPPPASRTPARATANLMSDHDPPPTARPVTASPRATPARSQPVPTLGFESSPSARTHRVVAGDTLYALAIRFGTTVQALMEANDLPSSDLRIGQVLVLP